MGLSGHFTEQCFVWEHLLLCTTQQEYMDKVYINNVQATENPYIYCYSKIQLVHPS